MSLTSAFDLISSTARFLGSLSGLWSPVFALRPERLMIPKLVLVHFVPEVGVEVRVGVLVVYGVAY